MVGISRGTVGVRLTLPLGSGVQCNACNQRWGICALNLVGCALRIRPRIDAALTWVLLCTGCGLPCNEIKHRGILPECKTCYAKRNTRNNVCYRCFTGSGELLEYQALNNGRRCVFWSCARHKPRILGYESVEVSTLASVRSETPGGYIQGRR